MEMTLDGGDPTNMDSSWTKVREMVANRVLTRHLHDLQEQQGGTMETTQSRQGQASRARETSSRSRSTSLHNDITDPLLPFHSRRRSKPSSPGTKPTTTITPTFTTTSTSSRPPSRRGTRGGTGARVVNGLGLGLGPAGMAGDPRAQDSSDEDLLELMAKTLRTASVTEQQRARLHAPSSAREQQQAQLHPQSSIPPGHRLSSSNESHKSSSSSSPSSSITTPGSNREQQPPRASPRANDPTTRPRLEREKTFIQTDPSELSSSPEERASLPSELANRATSGKPLKRARERRSGERGGGDGRGSYGGTVHNLHHRPATGLVTVGFYDEHTGIHKDDGGFTPKDLGLDLNVLRQEDMFSQEVSEDDEEGDDEDDDYDDDDEGGGDDEKDPWSEVKKCQYIRGYEPPSMRMPKDAVKFVFNNTG